MSKKIKTIAIRHPEYMASIDEWTLYRNILIGGKTFIEAYLKKFSAREDSTDFADRKEMTYCPGHAEAVLNEIKNAIYQRMADITRTNLPVTLQQAISENDGTGIDLHGNSMTDFIGGNVIQELLGMGKVGIYVDRDIIEPGTTKANMPRPYVYYYKAEDILSWKYERGKLVNVLLREYDDIIDDDSGLVYSSDPIYRQMRIIDGYVSVIIYDKQGREIVADTLQLKEIPLIIGQLTTSLLKNIDRYQKGLLNLASSDMNYAIKSNFTFYTEQYDPVLELTALREAASLVDEDSTSDGSKTEAILAKMRESRVGVAVGRRYPRGLDRPGFISPDTSPLLASMQKQDQMRKEIREIANLNVSNLEPRRETAEAKKFNERTLEAGLSCIGLELQFIERMIAYYWAMYEDADTSKISIKYPMDYSLKSDEQRQTEAESLRKRGPGIASITYQKEVAKSIVRLELGNRVPEKVLNKITEEIDKSIVPFCDPDTINTDIESRILSAETGAKIRQYPGDEANKAQKEHAERTAAILVAQRQLQDSVPGGNDSARGSRDTDTNGDK